MAGGVSTEELRAIVTDRRSVTDLRRYFSQGADGRPAFTGSRFTALGGGGDQPETANRITAADILAVSLLSVTIPGEVVLDLVEGRLGAEISELLIQVPTDVDLGSAAAAVVLDADSPATRAWNRLEQTDGMGWVSAGKLLARKRPWVIPVYDRVVRCALDTPTGPWLWLNDRFAEDDGDLVVNLLGRRVEANVPDTVSPARVLDVILWMRHRGTHTNTGVCPRTELPRPA